MSILFERTARGLLSGLLAHILGLVPSVSLAESLIDEARACSTAIKASDAYKEIGDLVPWDVRDQSLQLLANSARPTAEQSDKLLRHFESVARCDRKLVEALRDRYKPDSRPSAILDSCVARLRPHQAGLVSGRLTFGDFATRRAEIHSECQNDFADMGARLRKEDEASRSSAAQIAAEQAARKQAEIDSRNAAAVVEAERRRLQDECLSAMMLRPTWGGYGEALSNAAKCNADPKAHLKSQTVRCRRDGLGNTVCTAE
jgi:hypothetical protein